MLEQSNSLTQQHDSDVSTETWCTLFPVDPQAQKRSEFIDRALEDDAIVRKKQVRILPLGAFSMREIIKQLKSNDEIGLTEDELIDYRYNIHQFSITCIKALVDVIKSTGFQLGEVDNNHYSYLCDHIAVPHGDVPLTEKAGQAIHGLWKDSSIREIFQASTESDLKRASTYFFQEINKIAAPDYMPTEADIIQSHKGLRGVSEHRVLVNGLSIHLIDVGTQRCERRKWIHQFENITAILFVVDLPCYDQEASGNNAMAEQIVLFDNVVNSKWFANAKFILFLSDVSTFREKLSHRPLEDSFPEYAGGADFEKASEFLLQRFRKVNRGHRRLYPYLVDPHVASNIELVAGAIKNCR